MPQTGTEMTRFPLFLLDQAVAMGSSRERLLRESGLSPADLDDPDLRIQGRKSVALWRVVLGEAGELAIHEIAYLLGYSEPSTFYRAFKRWTDSSPREYRAASESSG